mmetsp:Transcript_45286/g.109626  ORF Transcript_45286/g.109626 Transcript_45286/m.109626 type:complete len:85 (-) Transcript_45286:79-333(-)
MGPIKTCEDDGHKQPNIIILARISHLFRKLCSSFIRFQADRSSFAWKRIDLHSEVCTFCLKTEFESLSLPLLLYTEEEQPRSFE